MSFRDHTRSRRNIFAFHGQVAILIYFLLFSTVHVRDVDAFIEHLENTIAFFTGLQDESEDKADDDFVPFI